MPSRTDRLDMRLAPSHKRLVERAARAAGQTVSSFAVSTLVQRSREILQEESVTRLSPRDFRTLLALLDRDETPAPALSRAARRFRSRG
jgi:uncharacterized protein (DUF1778 family)